MREGAACNTSAWVPLGVKVSRIALGCMSFGVAARAWRLDEAASLPVMRQALELGINCCDTADIHGAGESEIVLGGRWYGTRAPGV